MRLTAPNTIYCAVCQRPVDRVECYENAMNRSRTFRVYCHGATEEATLTDLDLAVASNIHAVAFGPKDNLLTPPTPEALPFVHIIE